MLNVHVSEKGRIKREKTGRRKKNDREERRKGWTDKQGERREKGRNRRRDKRGVRKTSSCTKHIILKIWPLSTNSPINSSESSLVPPTAPPPSVFFFFFFLQLYSRDCLFSLSVSHFPFRLLSPFSPTLPLPFLPSSSPFSVPLISPLFSLPFLPFLTSSSPFVLPSLPPHAPISSCASL